MLFEVRKHLRNMKSVAVIGAGAAGLCMARYLAAEKQFFKIVVYEQGSQIGGTWIYDDISLSPKPGAEGMKEMENNSSYHSSMYKSLRTNLPKQVMAYPDFPFPEKYRTFPTHNEVLNYLEDYSSKFNLENFICFNEKVTHVMPLPQENEYDYVDNVKWNVKTSNVQSGQKSSAVFDSIVICNGHFSVPSIPEIPGIENYKGSVLHSHFYRVPDAYINKDVIVLGARSSGRDIAVEISRVAKSVILSHRDKSGKCPLPENIIEKVSIKSITSEGRVVFQDGSDMSADAMVFCTGYEFNISFLDKSCNIHLENGRIFPLHHQIFNAHYPSMAFVGLQNVVCPCQLFSLQARWIAKVLTGRTNLPTTQEMKDNANDELRKRIALGISEKYFHRFDKDLQWEYYNKISKEGDVEPMKPVIQKLYKATQFNRDTDLLKYRETEYKVLNDDEYEIILK